MGMSRAGPARFRSPTARRVSTGLVALAGGLLTVAAILGLTARSGSDRPPPPQAPTSTALPSATVAPKPVTREAWLWPFSPDSPWNVGVGSEAAYEGVDSPATVALRSPEALPMVNAGSWSHPIYKASITDPLATVSRPGYPDA